MHRLNAHYAHITLQAIPRNLVGLSLSAESFSSVFSHNKSVNSTFSHGLSAKRIGVIQISSNLTKFVIDIINNFISNKI